MKITISPDYIAQTTKLLYLYCVLCVCRQANEVNEMGVHFVFFTHMKLIPATIVDMLNLWVFFMSMGPENISQGKCSL